MVERDFPMLRLSFGFMILLRHVWLFEARPHACWYRLANEPALATGPAHNAWKKLIESWTIDRSSYLGTSGLTHFLVKHLHFAIFCLLCSVIACTARHVHIVFLGVSPRSSLAQ